jgi:hypothetical protein
MSKFDRALEAAYDRIALSKGLDVADKLCLAAAALPQSLTAIVESYASVHTHQQIVDSLCNGMIPF